MTLTIVRGAGLITIQDLGRPGRMHEALAPGGALVPELLVAANRAAGNPDAAPALEILGSITVRAEVTIMLATTSAHELRAGEQLAITSEPRRVAYLAVRGGIDAPLVLGGRGTQLSAGIGAALRAGDRIASAGMPEVASAVAAWPTDAGAIRVIAGPDAGTALAQLLAGAYRISPRSDRVGTRLEGPALVQPADPAQVSRPMVRGAIELPPDGLPIILGPEHPTTGGYPVIAVIAHADLGRFFAIRLGGVVHFASMFPVLSQPGR